MQAGRKAKERFGFNNPVLIADDAYPSIPRVGSRLSEQLLDLALHDVSVTRGKFKSEGHIDELEARDAGGNRGRLLALALVLGGCDRAEGTMSR
jgi:hypothetical protein